MCEAGDAGQWVGQCYHDTSELMVRTSGINAYHIKGSR